MKEYKSNLDRVSLIRHKTDIPRAKIVSSKDAAQYAMKFYHEDISIYESMFLIMLNNNNNTIGYVKVSAGGMTGTLVDIRLVAKWCLECLATSFILVHNHPSGNLKFSEADKSISKKVRDGLKILDIKLLDSLVVVESGDYISMADDGIL